MLKGYRTYIVAALAILGAIGAVLTGESSIGDAIQLIVTAVLGATIRSGVKTDTGNA